MVNPMMNRNIFRMGNFPNE